MISDLTQYLKVLTAELDANNVSIPPGSAKEWHLFMYRLKRESTGPNRPTFLDGLRFDWDGPYPVSTEVAEVLSSFHWNASASAANPHFDQIALRPEVKDLWYSRIQEMAQPDQDFMKASCESASKIFASYVEG